MSIIRLPAPVIFPVNTQRNFTTGNSAAIDSGTKKLFHYGRISGPRFTGTKTIKRIHGRWGTCVVTSGTRMKIEIDGVADTAYTTPAGSPFQEVASWDISGIGSGAAFFTSPDFSNIGGGHAVSWNEILGFIFSLSTYEATNSITLYTQSFSSMAHVGIYTGSWAASTNQDPSIAVEFTDGSYATLSETTIGPSYEVSSTLGNEFGNQFTFNVPVEVAGISVNTRNNVAPSSGLGFDFRLFRDSVKLQSVNYPVGMFYNSTVQNIVRAMFTSPVIIDPGVPYQATVRRSDQSGGPTHYRMELPSATIKEAIAGDISLVYRTNDAASFTVVDTSIGSVGLLISGVHDGVTGFF